MRKYLVAALIIAGLSAACEGTTSYLHSTNDPDADTGDAGIPGTEDDAGEPDAGRPDGGRPDAGPPKSGESCNKAIDVSGGGVFQGSTLNAPYEYQTCNVGGVGVGARVYTLQTSTAQRFTVEATPTTAAFTHLSMAVKRDCDEPFVCLSESMIHLAGGTSVKTVFDLEAGKRVFLFVTGALLDDPSTAKGNYTLNVQTDPSPSGNNCSTAIDITRGGSWGSSTVGTGDDYQPGASCTKPHLPGPDRVYTVTSPTTRKYNLRLDTFSGGESQLSLFVMNGCNPQTCATVSMPGSLGGEFTATAGTSYFIVVKGTMSPGNNYILHVEAL